MLINLLSNPLLPVALGIIGLIAALIVYGTVKASPAGEGRVKEIGDEIHLGAMVFMSAEYSFIKCDLDSWLLFDFDFDTLRSDLWARSGIKIISNMQMCFFMIYSSLKTLTNLINSFADTKMESLVAYPESLYSQELQKSPDFQTITGQQIGEAFL